MTSKAYELLHKIHQAGDEGTIFVGYNDDNVRWLNELINAGFVSWKSRIDKRTGLLHIVVWDDDKE